MLEQTAREKKGNKKWLPLLVTLVVILAAAGILYGTGVLAAPVFPIGTKVSGVSVSEQSAKEAGETLQQAAEDYKLTVRFAQNTRTFSAEELGLTVDEDALKRLVKVMQQGQNAASAAEDAQTVFTCETDLKEEMQDLPERTAHADKATQDAVLTYDKKAGKYVIQEEQVGGTIDTQALAEAVQTAAEQLQPELDAVGAGLYGMGYYCPKPSLMAAYRQHILDHPERMAALAEQLNGQDLFHLEGEEYKRPKGTVSELLQPWFNRKNVSLCAAFPADETLFSPALIPTLTEGFQWLWPYYSFLKEIQVPLDGRDR